MIEYRVVWQRCPRANHPGELVLFVEAEDLMGAEAIARDHIERKHGITWFTVLEAMPVAPLPTGKVLTQE